jgi:hypothetical protein
MLKTFVTSFLLLSFCVCSKTPAPLRNELGSETPNTNENRLATALKEAERYYARILPRMADDETRLESVRATATEFRFESTLVNTLKSELDLQLVTSLLQTDLEEQARKLEKLNSLLQLGATLVYSYKDREGTDVTEVRITPKAAAKAPLSPDDGLANAKLVYWKYVQYAVNFDPSIATLYADLPKISLTRNYPDGTSQTKTVPAWRHREFIGKVMPLAKQRGDEARFSQEDYERVGEDKVRIKVKQYSVLGEYWSDVTLLVVRTGDKWLIAEDLTVSAMPRNAEAE